MGSEIRSAVAHIFVDDRYGVRAVLCLDNKVIELAHIDDGVSERVRTFINTINRCKSSQMVRRITSKFYRQMRDVNHCLSRDVVQCIASCMSIYHVDKVTMDDINYINPRCLGIWAVWNCAQLVSFIEYKLTAATGLTLQVGCAGHDA